MSGSFFIRKPIDTNFVLDYHRSMPSKGFKHSPKSRKLMSLHMKGRVPWNKGLGGRIVKNGYVLIRKPNHPFATATGYVREHRLAMEGSLGRYLEPSEVIHHLDGNKQNNKLDNLRLYASNKEHENTEHIKRTNFRQVLVQCLSCNKEFYKHRSQIWVMRNGTRKETKPFCSMGCSWKYHQGGNWRPFFKDVKVARDFLGATSSTESFS